MKIVFVLPGRGHSGGVRVTVIAANMLLERGHDVRILYRKPAPGLRTLYRSMKTRLKSPGKDWLDGFKGGVAAFTDITGCRFSPLEAIIAVGMWASGQLSRLDNTASPKVQYIHGATPWAPELMKEALGLPFSKIVVASYLVPVVESYGGHVSAVIHNGVDSAEYFDASGGRKDGVGTIYSSHPAKDPETVLASLLRIRELSPSVPVRVFSTDKRPALIDKDSFTRHPTVDQARNIYSSTRVWIMASRSEGFPAPVLEAMSCGCAVIATRCGGTTDVITDGVNGFLVDVGDVQGIAGRAVEILKDDALFRRVSDNARETVREFTWPKAIDAIEEVLHGLGEEGVAKARSLQALEV